MSIKRVLIEGDERLEGMLHEGAGKGGAVICHPHPLYGGSMWNNVVEAIEEGFARSGYTTLRFNFRGVGSSTGRYDDGVGEAKDVVAACRFLQGVVGKDAALVLAGYSFGAWMCSRALGDIGDKWTLFFVAYPFAVYPLEALPVFRGRIYFVGGSADDISPLDDLLKLYKDLEAEKHLKVIPAYHNFGGREEEISDYIMENFSEETKVKGDASESP